MGNSGLQQLLSVGEVARRLDAKPHQVRRMAEYYAAHLGEATNPSEPGQARRFTEVDVQTLQAAQRLRAQGLAVSVVNERLGGLSIGEVEQGAIEPAHDALTGDLVSTALLARIDALLALGERVQELEKQRTRLDVIYLVLMAFLAGLVLGVALWWFR